MQERRRYPRIPTDEPAILTVLGPKPRRLSGIVTDISARGIQLRLDYPVPISAPLRIDVFGTMLLGEACYSTLVDGHWHAGILLDHVVEQVEEIAVLENAM